MGKTRMALRGGPVRSGEKDRGGQEAGRKSEGRGTAWPMSLLLTQRKGGGRGRAYAHAYDFVGGR
jgi:hypothetical protein